MQVTIPATITGLVALEDQAKTRFLLEFRDLGGDLLPQPGIGDFGNLVLPGGHILVL